MARKIFAEGDFMELLVDTLRQGSRRPSPASIIPERPNAPKLVLDASGEDAAEALAERVLDLLFAT